MSEFKILVVEDDRSVSNLITTTLRINQYDYVSAASGKEAIALCASHQPDMILLDLGLPDMDGIEVIETVRTWSTAGIIIISARGEDSDKIQALDSGADDYLTKPFSVEELLARIRAAQRRKQYMLDSRQDTPLFTNGPLTIDYAANVVFLDGREIRLTATEYRLLCLLARNVGKVLTHVYILDHIWGNSMESDIVSLRVYMTSLRKKLKTQGQTEELIKTHIGIGYQMLRIV